MNITSKLIRLADSLDKLGLRKDADTTDKLISKSATIMSVPTMNRLTQVPEEVEIIAPIVNASEDLVIVPESEPRKEPGMYLDRVFEEIKELEKKLRTERHKKHKKNKADDLVSCPQCNRQVYPGELHEWDSNLEVAREMGEPHRSGDPVPESFREKGLIDILEEPEIEYGFEDENEGPTELDVEFLAPDEELMVHEVDDGLIDELKEKLKEAPDLAMKLLTLVKENPELLALLAL